MSFYLADRNGYVGDLASINGFMQMKKSCGNFLSPSTSLMRFLDEGETTEMLNVIQDIKFVIPRISEASIRSTLGDLKDSLSKAKEIAIVTQ